MAANTGSKVKAAGKRAGAWVYGIMQQKNWKRWVLLAVAAAGFLVIVSLVCDGVDYRKDPSALTPRSVYFYAETRDLNALLGDSGAWPLWSKDRLPTGKDQWNQLQVDFAGRMGEIVEGLGTRLPLIWLTGSSKAAIAFAPADAGAEAKESWALFLDFPTPVETMAEMRVEPGLKLTPVSGGKNIMELTGSGGGKLYFLAMAPWFIISSDAKLAQFAAGSLDQPAFSLARAGILPDWRRGTSVRGLMNPVYAVKSSGAELPSLAAFVGGWMTPDARLAFDAKVHRSGEVESTLAVRSLSETISGGGLWPLFKFLFGILGIALLAVIVATILIMVGWGGWLKAVALRAGIIPAAAPVHVEPSAAFKEDTGMKGAKESLEAVAVEKVDMAPDSSDNASFVPTDPETAVEEVVVRNDEDSIRKNGSDTEKDI